MKFYAVKKGRRPGIYSSWPECQEQIKGFSGAIFKSFPTKAEAEKFIQEVEKPAKFDRVFYTDGSFQNGVSGGAAVDTNEKRVYYRRNEEKELQTNSRGELLGIILALKNAKQRETIHVFTDSQYCINILQNGYSISDNKDLVETYLELKQNKQLVVFLEYVQAHVGHYYNELADTYAEQSLTSEPGVTHSTTFGLDL